MTITTSQGAGPQGALRCRACGADVAPGALRCDRCGAAQSDTTCPHCRATAGASLDAELRYVCDVCGGPRIPLGAGGARRSGSENAPLKAADAARKGRAKWRAGAAVSGALLPMALLFSAIIAWLSGSVVASLLVPLVAVVPLAFALAFSLARAKAKGREIQPALDAAWIAAATDVIAQSQRALAPRDLAAALGIDEQKAEELLAMADVQGSIGGAHQRTNAMASFDARLRVATDRAGATDAEIEAAAEAEAAAAAGEVARRQSRGS